MKHIFILVLIYSVLSCKNAPKHTRVFVCRIPILNEYYIWFDAKKNPDSIQADLNKMCTDSGGIIHFEEGPYTFVKKRDWKNYDTLLAIVFIVKGGDTSVAYSTSGHLFDATNYGRVDCPSTIEASGIDSCYVYDSLPVQRNRYFY